MSASQNVELFSGEAGSAVTIYRFVVRAADGQYDHVAGAQGEADGVAAETQATVGGSLPIAALKTGSILKVELGATLSALDVIASDASGKAIAAVSTAGNYRLGKLLDGGVSGNIVRFQVALERDEA